MRRVREEREEGNLVFEHVKEGGFAGIIETKEENFGFFLPETEGSENAIEPIEEEHVLRSKRNGRGIAEQSRASF